MYARLLHLTFGQDVTHDQAHALYQDMVKECRTFDGFCGCAFMLMSNARRGLTITYWEDADCASRAGERMRPMIIGRMQGILVDPPEVVGYEVIDQVMTERGSPR